MSKSSGPSLKAICLFSGGLDSTTVVYEARRKGREVIALTVDYGQLHRKEVDAAREICQMLSIQQYSVRVNLPWGGSSLLNCCLPMPRNRDESHMTDIPNTYVPARNSLLLSMACSCAEAEAAQEVYIGVNALDYSGYPDCRPTFITAFQKMILEGTKAGVTSHPIELQTPLIHLSKKEIVELGMALNVPFEKTWSCYQGSERPCGTCDSCILRAKGFQEAGIPDPLLHP